MRPKCLNCSKNMSLAWFTLSFHTTRCRCVNCGALHEFTKRHKYIGGVFALPLIFLVSALEPVIPWMLLRVILLLLTAITLIPGQHKITIDDSVVFYNKSDS